VGWEGGSLPPEQLRALDRSDSRGPLWDFQCHLAVQFTCLNQAVRRAGGREVLLARDGVTWSGGPLPRAVAEMHTALCISIGLHTYYYIRIDRASTVWLYIGQHDGLLTAAHAHINMYNFKLPQAAEKAFRS